MRHQYIIIIITLVTLVAGSIPLSGSGDEATSNNPFTAHRGDSPLTLLGNADDYDFLIISPQRFQGELEPFVCHKNSHGIDTILVTLKDIYDGTYFETHGRDEAEMVKYFIRDCHETWGIRYVLMVGGRHGGLMNEKWWMPVRYIHLDDKSQWETTYLSDLYFADLYDSEGMFSSWDTNNNGIYGEWSDDTAEDKDLDLRPDVYVGRWACRNILEVRIMVQKVITYENNSYGKSWFNKMICVAGDTYPAIHNPLWVGNEGEEYTQRAIDWMPGYTPLKLWASLGTFTGPRDVITAVSDGCGFLFFDGHGSPMSWATHAPNSDQWIDGLTVWQIPQLSNGDMLPICIVGGCHNSQFNITLLNIFKLSGGLEEWYNYLWKGETGPECWSWWMTRKIGGGSIATLGYSGLGYTREDKNFEGEATEWLDTHFFWEYGMNDTQVLGDIWGNVITSYLDIYPINWQSPAGSNSALDAKTVQEWILLGDPSLMIGGYPPS